MLPETPGLKLVALGSGDPGGKMDKQAKAQWVAALRSGDYRQGEGKLFSLGTNTYCCLGVLCDLHDMLDGEGRNERGYVDYPSDALCSRVGLSSSRRAHLARLNDSGGSFADIADYIEKNL